VGRLAAALVYHTRRKTLFKRFGSRSEPLAEGYELELGYKAPIFLKIAFVLTGKFCV
jgi:hypothetical protein